MSGRKKVFVGLSGGVDSAVSAALLTERGFDVTGVFIKTWHPDFLPCTWREERREAMRVAAHLNIPFVTLDLEEAYKQGVAMRMIAEYAAGRTPNPDTLCNREIKFGGFLAFARQHGASVATGHYARVREGEEAQLLAGVDPEKDQSYFLWMVKGEDLRDVMFPIGDMHKTQVRALAKRFGLPNAEKKDSQGICFLGDVSMPEFLGHYLDLKKGEVLDEKGTVIGWHGGSLLYALGQRHGFTVPLSSEPLYVVGKNVEANTITVAPHVPREAQMQNLRLVEENWMGTHAEGPCKVRLRYREPLRDAELLRDEKGTWVRLKVPSLIPLGQSLVLYRDDQVLGGGILDSAT